MSNTVDKERSDPDIDALVRNAQAGNMASFDELVRMFQRPMYNLSYRMMGNADDAADAAQEIFVKMYRAINKFEGRSKFSTWLYTLASNTCRTQLRKRGRTSKVEVRTEEYEDAQGRSYAAHEAVDAADLPGKAIERSEIMGEIQNCLSYLPEEFREVIIMRDMQGLTYDEIASAIQCSLGTVKSRLSRARSTVKEQLVRKGLKCAVKK